ncbi:kinase-like domain-containing protein [Halteromyces radiatus]|uniref:kinase-like domain-containing protein n=1 Tax=Halteromyces radiatus TaxID=101107 RepID=UPI0022202FCC|nr:kinase-like domain-containing protein [Halteromyces radiatus]KAI8092961.1 kinase-like domain-containing protein [Halteromyces radiatus]
MITDDETTHDQTTSLIMTELTSPLPPPSAFVDYTPRHITVETPPHSSPSSHTNEISLLRQKRALYYRQLAQKTKSHSTKNYMDSPLVRRNLGVNPSVIPIDIHERKQVSSMTNQKKKEWSTDDFDVGKHLGTGKFGNVYMAREKQSRQVVAMKILIKKELQEAGVAHFLRREVEIHAHLRHPHILRMYGYFQDHQHIYLVLDCATQGSLYNKLEEHGRFTDILASKCIHQVASALYYLHKLGVIHRDIKPENILIDKQGHLQLADFGWAVFDRQPRRNTFCGTLDYLPPEMIGNRPHNAKVDVWALGVLTYELLVGKPPFEHVEYMDTYQHITRVDYTFPDHVGIMARSFISLALQQDVHKRCNLSDLIRHHWLKKLKKRTSTPRHPTS